jgi:hypothetical protein
VLHGGGCREAGKGQVACFAGLYQPRRSGRIAANKQIVGALFGYDMAYVVAANHDRCDGHTCLLTNLDRVQSHDKGWLSLLKMLPVANALNISDHQCNPL